MIIIIIVEYRLTGVDINRLLGSGETTVDPARVRRVQIHIVDPEFSHGNVDLAERVIAIIPYYIIIISG
jgi:hypothetical protein